MPLAPCNYKLRPYDIKAICVAYSSKTSTITELATTYRVCNSTVKYHLGRNGLYTVKHKACVGRRRKVK